MAGSYRHIVDEDNNFCGIDRIDNLGDAHEALEECYHMIQHFTGGDKTKVFEAYCAYVRKVYPHVRDADLKESDFWER